MGFDLSRLKSLLSRRLPLVCFAAALLLFLSLIHI